jgi:hypothetical protein
MQDVFHSFLEEDTISLVLWKTMETSNVDETTVQVSSVITPPLNATLQ